MKELNIKKFKYYKLIEEMTEKEKTKRQQENKKLPKKDRAVGSEKLMRIKILARMKTHMNGLLAGNKVDLLLYKELKLEREYILQKEKMDLAILIEAKTGQPAGGSYNLADIGRVMGLTRERVRQIEAAVMKVLKHPSVGRKIKHFTKDSICGQT